jgi:(p)ppGpp synthase/HD superfamily hydrolase
MPLTPGYSDRISHAFAFAAKHGPQPRQRGAGVTYLSHPAGVAIILARFGCDETSIVSGVLGVLMNDAPAPMRPDLGQKIRDKFGESVASVVHQVTEPRYDDRGKERGWEAYKMDFLADLAGAEPRVLEVFTATQLHTCGTLLTDIRRLGVEYLSNFAPATASDIRWWYRAAVEALERHPIGPRPGMVDQLRRLAGRLETELGRSRA